MNTSTEKLVAALRVLSSEIQSDDGVANAAIQEAAQRLEQQSEKIKRLYEGILKNNQEIEQTCGKVLGYPWFKDDQKNFPGATEKDGVCVGDHVGETIVSELAKKYHEALTCIDHLKKSGDDLLYDLSARFRGVDGADSILHGATSKWGKIKKRGQTVSNADDVADVWYLIALIRDAVDDPIGKIRPEDLIERCRLAHEKAQETDALRDRVKVLEEAGRVMTEQIKLLAENHVKLMA